MVLTVPRKILIDEAEVDPILGFNEYSEAIVKIVKNSTPNFCIGIHGKWGNGKTTLMRLVHSFLEIAELFLT